MLKVLRGITFVLAAGFVALAPVVGLAQTRPALTSLGPDYPKIAIFIGNSFFRPSTSFFHVAPRTWMPGTSSAKTRFAL
jgi:hypothetical protein